MHVVTDLTPGDVVAAQLRSIHALRGIYNRVSVMDQRSIVSVTRDGDVVTLTLSDGAQFHPGGYPAEGDKGNKSYIVALRDPSSPTGELLPDGPALTYDAALKFQAVGITDTEVIETIARGADAVDTPIATAKTTPPAPPTATETFDVVALPQAQPAPMTQQSAPDTHVVVHSDSVSALHRLLDEARAGVAGAFEKLEHAFAHVFHHGSAS